MNRFQASYPRPLITRHAILSSISGEHCASDSTAPTGINKWNTLVGSKTYGDFWECFYSNGLIVALVYPGPRPTYPKAINDSGTVVGLYCDDYYNEHGFIWNNGKWATLGTTLL